MGASISSFALFTMAPEVASAMKADRAAADGKKRLVFFFTGTGNSLFVAKSLSETPLSIPQELKKGSLAYEADEIGFVFPDFAAAAPMIVQEFLKKATFKAPYIFSVITYGNDAVNVTDWWNKFAKDNGVTNNYIKTILMVDNYLPAFDMNSQKKLDKNVDANLATIVSEVSARKKYIEPGKMGNFTKEMLDRVQKDHFTKTADELFALNTNACVGCMRCAAVCPHTNFKRAASGVEFGGKCEYCLACVHVCPQKALTMKNGERNAKARYRNPNVSVAEIIKANRQ